MMIIHRYWTGDAPKPTSSVIAGRIASNYGDLIDWTDEMLTLPIRQEIIRHKRIKPEGNLGKHMGNIVRLALLREYGGLWIDHDVVLMSQVDESYSWSAQDGPHLCSAAMHFIKGDPRLDLALNSVRKAATVRDSSGEGMLARVWTDVPTIPFGYEFSGKESNYRPWAIHLWGSRT